MCEYTYQGTRYSSIVDGYAAQSEYNEYALLAEHLLCCTHLTSHACLQATRVTQPLSEEWWAFKCASMVLPQADKQGAERQWTMESYACLLHSCPKPDRAELMNSVSAYAWCCAIASPVKAIVVLERPYSPADVPPLGGALSFSRTGTASSSAIVACASHHGWSEDYALMTDLVKHCNMIWPWGYLFINADPFGWTSLPSTYTDECRHNAFTAGYYLYTQLHDALAHCVSHSGSDVPSLIAMGARASSLVARVKSRTRRGIRVQTGPNPVQRSHRDCVVDLASCRALCTCLAGPWAPNNIGMNKYVSAASLELSASERQRRSAEILAVTTALAEKGAHIIEGAMSRVLNTVDNMPDDPSGPELKAAIRAVVGEFTGALTEQQVLLEAMRRSLGNAVSEYAGTMTPALPGGKGVASSSAPNKSAPVFTRRQDVKSAAPPSPAAMPGAATVPLSPAPAGAPTSADATATAPAPSTAGGSSTTPTASPASVTTPVASPRRKFATKSGGTDPKDRGVTGP